MLIINDNFISLDTLTAVSAVKTDPFIKNKGGMR